MRVKDLKQIIADLPDDQTVQIVVFSKSGVPYYAKEFRDTRLDAYGILEVQFQTPDSP